MALLDAAVVLVISIFATRAAGSNAPKVIDHLDRPIRAADASQPLRDALAQLSQ
jgi:hypothetical protein